LVFALGIVGGQPLVEVGLQLVDRPVDLLAKRNLVELLENRLVEALADPIRLRSLRLGLRVIDALSSR
jgi:hypothetical protein